MTLQILVPQYEETDEVIKPLLDSIAIQQSISFDDVGVIICNDGSDVFLSEELLTSYPYKIEYYKEPHRGVSATRNTCLDHATADYVMFCDADDMFFNACGMWIIFREMAVGFDSLVSSFLEEVRYPDSQDSEYMTHTMDSTFVHGKVHRRQYLLDRNIRWNDKLTIHEDSYFNILCQNLSDKIKYCETAFYLWKWRDNSVCRHDPKYILKTYPNLLDSSDQLVDEFMRRGMHERANAFVASSIFDAYYTMNKEEWLNQENQDYRRTTEMHFANYFRKHRDQWNYVSPEEKMQISNQIRSRCINEGMRMEAITIDAWLKHIMKLLKKK